MALMWITVGLITGLSVFGGVELNKRYDINWLGWSGLVLGEFLILFCIAWSTASIFEGVPRSASMGLLMFGGAGLVTLILTWRFVVQKSARSAG
jgi:hypothetical protein